MKIIKLIRCAFGFHKYFPSFEQRWIEYRKGTRKRHFKSRFTCANCGKKTKWLNRKETEEMLDSERCGW